MEATAKTGRHQTPKSIATRKSIIEAAIQCIIEIGYFQTTTTEIAKAADVTRGAVQYYFPTTPDVLRAATNHILTEWTREYSKLIKNVPPDVNKFDFAIDIYWEHVKNPYFIAWQDLVAASRTDPELAEIVCEASKLYDSQRQDLAKAMMPEMTNIPPKLFLLGRDFGRILIEGLSLNQLSFDKVEREEAIINLLKYIMRTFWEQFEPKEKA